MAYRPTLDERKAFAERITAARLRRGWSKTRLAHEAGVRPALISSIELWNTVPRPENRRAIETALGAALVPTKETAEPKQFTYSFVVDTTLNELQVRLSFRPTDIPDVRIETTITVHVPLGADWTAEGVQVLIRRIGTALSDVDVTEVIEYV